MGVIVICASDATARVGGIGSLVTDFEPFISFSSSFIFLQPTLAHTLTLTLTLTLVCDSLW